MHLLNIFDIEVTLDVLKFLTFNDKKEQFANIDSIDTTFDVSKCWIFNDILEQHPSNIDTIDVT